MTLALTVGNPANSAVLNYPRSRLRYVLSLTGKVTGEAQVMIGIRRV